MNKKSVKNLHYLVFYCSLKLIFSKVFQAMKNIFIIYFSVFALNAFSDSADFYTIINRTNHDIKVTANFWKAHEKYPLQFLLSPFACLRIHEHYHYRDYDYVGHIFSETYNIDRSFVEKWTFAPDSLSLLIDDGSAYEMFDGLDLYNYEVTGKANAILNFFDSFKLHWNEEPNKSYHISDTCETFAPEEALFVGEGGNTRLHDAVFAYDYEKVDHLLKNGAEMHLKNKEGRTPIDVAKQLKDEQMFSIFQSYSTGGRISP